MKQCLSTQKSKPVFFLAYAILFQVFFAVIGIVYHDVVILGPAFVRPEISPEYWEWFLDVREPMVSYERELVLLCIAVRGLSILILAIGIILLSHQCFLRRSARGRWAAYVTMAMVLYAASIVWRRLYAEPYYLYMDLLLPEILSLLYLCMFLFCRGTSKQHHE